jgi:protease-4
LTQGFSVKRIELFKGVISMKTFRNILVKALAIIGGMVLLSCLVIGVALFIFIGIERIPDRTILEIDFERKLLECVPDGPIARLMLTDTATVRDVVDALEMASSDHRVVALIARVGSADIGMAQIQELRDAVLAFRTKGGSAVAFAETLGEFGPGNTAYYLASAFDEIYLQPSGDLGLTGLIAESAFFNGTLEKLGIIPRFDHRQEYKNFMNLLTERKYTEPHREAVQRILNSQFGQIVEGIAEARELSQERVRVLVDQGPFLGQEAVEVNLVDGLAYRDEVYQQVKTAAGENARFLYLTEYLERAGRPHTKGDIIALIYGVGGVQRGQSGYDPTSGGVTMGSDTVTSAIRAAVEDADVKAIVFRVDSPGGSYVASDAIWREVALAREAGKPVIVSMGNVAGSGGYFVSMAADRIVAQPGTITGSIGVLGGKLVASDFLAKLGVTTDEVHTSANASMWSWNQDFTPEQWNRLQAWLDRIYEDFTLKVAEGRRLPEERVLEAAKGRIWTGEDAKDLGLVDELGGFPLALRLAREAAGISPDADIHLKLFPEEQSFLDMLLGREAESSEEEVLTEALTGLVQMAQPLFRLARKLGLDSHSDVLRMPEISPLR